MSEKPGPDDPEAPRVHVNIDDLREPPPSGDPVHDRLRRLSISELDALAEQDSPEGEAAREYITEMMQPVREALLPAWQPSVKGLEGLGEQPRYSPPPVWPLPDTTADHRQRMADLAAAAESITEYRDERDAVQDAIAERLSTVAALQARAAAAQDEALTRLGRSVALAEEAAAGARRDRKWVLVGIALSAVAAGTGIAALFLAG